MLSTANSVIMERDIRGYYPMAESTRDVNSRSQPIRKIVIAHESPDAHFGAKVGGAAKVALEQSKALHRMGRPIKLIGPSNGGNGAGLMIPHELFNMPQAASNDELLRFYKESDEWMSFWQGKFRVSPEGDVYGHYFVAGGIMSEMNGDIKGNRIYMGHSWDRVVNQMDPKRASAPIRSAAEKSILNEAHAVIVATEAERQILAKSYQDVVIGGKQVILNKTFVVPLGIDSDKYSPENIAEKRKEWRNKLLPEDLRSSLNFYMVGRIAPQKNQLNAVKAFCEAIRKTGDRNLTMSIFGGPLDNNTYYNELKEFIKTQPEYIQRRILFHGVVDGEIAHAVGDIFVGPSIWETFFLAAAEAMASGKPTIISDKAILKEVAGKGSIFVSDSKIDKIADSIAIMATNPDFRSFSSQYNKKRAWKNFTWGKSAQTLDDVWNKLKKNNIA